MKFYVLAFSLLIHTFWQVSPIQAEEIGGYTVGQWYTSKADPTVQFKLTKDPKENCAMYVMEVTLDAPLEHILKVIEDYGNYTKAGMPRMTKSTIIHLYNNDDFNFIMGKQRKFKVSVSDAPVAITRFKLNIPWLPDNTYTLLLTTYRDPETKTVYVYWIQYDETNYKNISGSWLAQAISPYYTNFWGRKVFNTSKYLNSNDDIYGSWTLIELSDQKTFVHYENYADPGFWGRQFQDDVVKSTLEDMPKIISTIRTQLPKQE